MSMENNNKLLVSYAPHLRGEDSIAKTMGNVVFALIPALVGAVYFFGFRALILTLVTVLSCVLSEYIWDRLTKKENTPSTLTNRIG